MLTQTERAGPSQNVVHIASGPPPDAESERPNAARLDEAVSSAYALLYHGVSSGKEFPPAVRGPIINLRAALARGEPISSDDESAFLDAYARLAVLTGPVTAETLRATSREMGRTFWWAKLLRLGPVSDAQRFAWYFGLLAVCLLGAVGMAEWTRTYITTITDNKKSFDANARELLLTNTAMEPIDRQIISLSGRLARQDDQSGAIALDALTRQRNELWHRSERLSNENAVLWKSLDAGYRSLKLMVPFAGPEELPGLIVPVWNTISAYLLPVLYGALGTCAFILRSLYAQMLDRSFDPRRSGEFVVRLFLGMLSGVTVQWIFGKESHGPPDATTPLVLAFLAGYSVELLFTGMDRLLAAVTGRIRSANPSPRAGRPGPASGSAANTVPPAAIKA